MTKVVSVGSGKGGVGKSLISINLAVLLAAKKHRVVLVDLDTGGANDHILMGRMNPEKTLAQFMMKEVESLEETAESFPDYGDLKLIPGMGDSIYTSNPPPAAKQKLLRHIRKLDADYVIIDVGAGSNLGNLDYFMAADINLCVAVPEPTSIIDLYSFIKLAVLRKALSVFVATDDVSKEIARSSIHSISQVYDMAEKEGNDKLAEVKKAISQFNPYLVFNKVNKSGKGINVAQMQKLLKDYVDIANFDLLGQIPRDEDIERSVQKCQPLVALAPAAAASRAFLALAEHVEALS